MNPTAPEPERPARDAEPQPPPATDAPTCEICGAAMFERHCKILCPRCGYQRDCTDP